MGGYKFEGKLDRNAPREEQYTFYIAGKDNSGNYSEPTEVKVQHPGIQQLNLESQDVKGLLSSIKIILPEVYSERSQTVYPSEDTSEAKKILGYRLHIQEIDMDTGEEIGGEEVIDYPLKELTSRSIYYQAETGKKFEIKVGAYDSVYHPEHNPSLYQSTISNTVTSKTFKVEPPDVSDGLIEPNSLTTSLQNWNDNLEEQITIKAGKEVNGEQIIGGIGLAYNSNENDIDVQVLADRFRLFDPDVSPDGTALFGVGTVDGKSQIFMDANEVTIAANDDNTEYTDGNFFVLDDEGLRIFTPNFKLDKSGTAIFNGEVNATQFSVGDWGTDTSGNNLPNANADVTADNPQMWEWIDDPNNTKPEDGADVTKQHTDDINHVGSTAPSSPSAGWFWYDTSNNKLKRYDGTSWIVQVDLTSENPQNFSWMIDDEDKPENGADVTAVHANDVNHIGSSAPSSPSSGWLWLDTSTDPDKLKKYNGSSWDIIGTVEASWAGIVDDGGKPVDNATQNVDFVQPDEPTGTSGDLWIDTDDNTPFIHDGSAWQRVTWDRISLDSNAPADNATVNDTFIQPSKPSDTSDGNLWIDSDNDTPYIANGNDYHRVSWSDISSDENAPDDNADITSENALDINYYGTSYPSNAKEGWMCVRTDKNPVPLERYDGSSWNIIATLGANWSDIVDDNDNMPSDNATENKTFAQSDPPSGVGESKGDIWIDSDTGTPYTYDGSGWKRTAWSDVSTDPDAPADNATENRLIRQSKSTDGTPTDSDVDGTLNDGDIWVNTDDGTPYFYDGGSWQRSTWDSIKDDTNAPDDNADETEENPQEWEWVTDPNSTKPEDNAKPNNFSDWEALAGGGNVIMNDLGLFGVDADDNYTFEINNKGNAYFRGEIQGAEISSNHQLTANDGQFVFDEAGFTVYDADTKSTLVTKLSEANNGGLLEIFDEEGTNVASLSSSSDETGTNKSGTLILYNKSGDNRVEAGISSTNEGGEIRLYDDTGTSVIKLKTNNQSDGSYFTLLESDNSTKVSIWHDMYVWIPFYLKNLPTSDPNSSGQVWNDNGTLKVSS